MLDQVIAVFERLNGRTEADHATFKDEVRQKLGDLERRVANSRTFQN